MEKVSRIYNIDISIKCYPLEIFEKNISKDILITEILKNHIIFLNSEEFIGLVLKYG